MKRFLKSILILTMILCFAIPAFAVKILPYNMPLHDIMSWDERSATLKIANPEGESVSVSWASTVDLWNYDGTTWKFDLPSGNVFEFGKQVTLGTSASPFSLTYDNKILSVYTTCASTNASTSFEPILFNTVMTGIGQVGGRVRVNMESNVALGSWANAFKASVDWKTAGGVTGLGSAICAEMTMPGGAAGIGTFGVLELELVCPSYWTSSQLVSFIYAQNSGSTAAKFVTEGYLFNIVGMGTPADDTVACFHLQNHVATTHALRILVNGVAYDIPLVATTYTSN